MAIKYAVQRTTAGKDKTVYYHARAQYDGVTHLDDIAQMVEQISAISTGDVLSVLNTLGKIVAVELANGRIVDLGDLGRIRLSLRAKGVATPEEVRHETIQSTRAIFVPGQAIRHKQQHLSFAYTSAEPQPRSAEDKPHDEPTQPENPPAGGGSDQNEENIGI